MIGYLYHASAHQVLRPQSRPSIPGSPPRRSAAIACGCVYCLHIASTCSYSSWFACVPMRGWGRRPAAFYMHRISSCILLNLLWMPAELEGRHPKREQQSRSSNSGSRSSSGSGSSRCYSINRSMYVYIVYVCIWPCDVYCVCTCKCVCIALCVWLYACKCVCVSHHGCYVYVHMSRHT